MDGQDGQDKKRGRVRILKEQVDPGLARGHPCAIRPCRLDRYCPTPPLETGGDGVAARVNAFAMGCAISQCETSQSMGMGGCQRAFQRIITARERGE
jgi:hypothetical protein